ncbi:MAG: MFS transporter [Deltaproteobacteria bacterium]|nr:MAG: MFS transporter [Deltaproteobacteria bacterium]RLC11814.1 MAG: MFS transporter [Deltaproteobacteria bacterium]
MTSSIDKRIFGTLFFSIFVTVTGVGIVVPLLPVYAHDLGAGGLAIGFIFGSFALSRTLFLPYFGRLSDKKGRKRLIVIGLLSYACLSLAFILAQDVTSLVVIRFFQGIASSMMMPAIQAYVGDITPQGREGFTMGFFNMSIFFGLSLGPVLGGSIKDYWGFDVSFLSMGILSLVGFFLSLCFLPPSHEETVVKKHRTPLPWKMLLQDREIIGLFCFRLNYTACIGIIWGFLPVLADTRFALSSSNIGFLVMLGVFISGVIHLPMGYMADRISRRMMIVVGGLLVAWGMIYFARSNSLTDLIVANLLFGLGGGISMPAHMAIAVFKGNQSDAMGSLMGLMTMAHSLGMLMGSSFAGLIMDIADLRDAFSLGTIISFAGVLMFFALTKPGHQRMRQRT